MSATDPFSPVLMQSDVSKYLAKVKSRPDPRIKAVKSGRVNNKAPQPVIWNERTRRYVFRSEEDRKVELQRIERERIAASLPIIWIFLVHEGQVGQLGDPRQPPFSDGLSARPRYSVLQIIDHKTALILATTSRCSTKFFLIYDKAMPEIQEEQNRYSFPGAYRVEAKQSYQTIAGAPRALPVLREFDLNAVVRKSQ